MILSDKTALMDKSRENLAPTEGEEGENQLSKVIAWVKFTDGLADAHTGSPRWLVGRVTAFNRRP